MRQTEGTESSRPSDLADLLSLVMKVNELVDPKHLSTDNVELVVSTLRELGIPILEGPVATLIELNRLYLRTTFGSRDFYPGNLVRHVDDSRAIDRIIDLNPKELHKKVLEYCGSTEQGRNGVKFLLRLATNRMYKGTLRQMYDLLEASGSRDPNGLLRKAKSIMSKDTDCPFEIIVTGDPLEDPSRRTFRVVLKG